MSLGRPSFCAALWAGPSAAGVGARLSALRVGNNLAAAAVEPFRELS